MALNDYDITIQRRVIIASKCTTNQLHAHLVGVRVEHPQDMSRVFVAHIFGEQSWEAFSSRDNAFQAPGMIGRRKGSEGVERPWILPVHEHALDEATGSGGVSYERKEALREGERAGGG